MTHVWRSTIVLETFLFLLNAISLLRDKKTVAYPDIAFTVILSATKKCPLTQSCIMPHKFTFGEPRTCSQGVQISCIFTRPFVWTAAVFVNSTRHKTSLCHQLLLASDLQIQHLYKYMVRWIPSKNTTINYGKMMVFISKEELHVSAYSGHLHVLTIFC